MRTRSLLTVFLSVAFIGCSSADRGGGESDVQAVDIDAWQGDYPISGPWLHQQLPEGVLTYERIPHPLGLMAIPKGNVFDTAFGSQANIQNLINLQQSLTDNLAIGLLPLELLDALRSPIEIAAIGAPPLSSVMIAATMSYRSNAEFEAYLAEVGELAPGLGLAAPLDDAGFGQIVLPPGLPIQVFVYFDQATGRLALYGGIVADRTSFARLMEPVEVQAETAIRAMETQIDDSGQGLFAWVDVAQLMQVGAGFVPPEAMQLINTLGIQSVGLGAGVADGKGRMKVLIDVGSNNVNRPMPIVRNVISATSVGDTRHLILLSIPSAAEFSRLENVALDNLPPEARDGWVQVKAAFAEESGTSIEEILAAIGPELITISDQAGDYFGLHINDQSLFDNLLDRWSEAGSFTIDQRNVGGQTIRSMELPSTFGMPPIPVEGDAAAVFEMISRMRTRFYWIADGEYLYFAGTPQVLIDRVNMGATSNVSEWLADTQRIDMSSSMIALTGSAQRLPRMLYNGYVGYMQVVADMVGADYDVWAMPTANQLGLPDRGTLGASLNLGEPYVSFELSYESHPAEFLIGGGGMAAVAGVGIAAAIALPAYQDYTLRAQVSEGLALASGPRAAAVEAYQNSGVAPVDRTSAGLSADPTDTSGQYVESVDIEDGQIVVVYGNAADPLIANGRLIITMYSGPDGSVVFRCGHAFPPDNLEPIGAESLNGTTLQPQYLPSGCRR